MQEYVKYDQLRSAVIPIDEIVKQGQLSQYVTQESISGRIASVINPLNDRFNSVIPSNASTTNKLATTYDVDDKIKDQLQLSNQLINTQISTMQTQISNLQNRVNANIVTGISVAPPPSLSPSAYRGGKKLTKKKRTKAKKVAKTLKVEV